MPALPRPALPRPARRALAAGLAAIGLAVAGCSTAAARAPSDEPPAVAGATEPGHGAVAGASEEKEPQLRLVAVGPRGSTAGIDLLTGRPVDLPDLSGATSVDADGRFLFAASPRGLTILDTGVWTVPHGDHAHYYRAEPRLVGDLDGGAEMRTESGASLVAVTDPAAGNAVVLDRDALGAGSVVPVAGITGITAGGLLVPGAAHLIQTIAGAPGTPPDTVRVLDRQGIPVPGAEVPCSSPAGTVTTRVGVVVGCAEGAVLAVPGTGTSTSTSTDLVHIPYPQPVPEADRARDFRIRGDRPVIAAVAGDRGAWLLDTRARSWSLLPTDTPLVAVAAVDDRDHTVVAVDRDGRILVLDAGTGAVTGMSEPLLAATMADPALEVAVTIEVDAARAYVNDPAGRRILEIDHGDGGRIAREFPVEDAPMFLALVGR